MVSQFLCGGRAGLLSSLLCVGVFAVRKTSVILPLAVILLIVYSFLPQELIVEKFRTAPEIVTRGKNIRFVSEEEYVDGLTSFRISGYRIGFEIFTQSPIVGWGFGQSDPLSDNLGYGPDIHNVWLKRLIEGGVILLFVLVYMFFNIYDTITKRIKRIQVENAMNYNSYKYFFYTLFFLGLAISMIEPNYLIGSIQGEATFWIYLGFLSREHLN
jgi:O-antigen ligase